MTYRSLKQSICYLMVTLMMLAGVTAQAQAAMISTGSIATEISSDIGREEIKSLLTREDVTEKLSAMGVDSADVLERVGAMTDAEIAQLHQQMDNLPAGAGALGAVVMVLLILILLDVAGVTDIFPKV
ncbi:PA2779 family protein [Porticoccus sp.]